MSGSDSSALREKLRAEVLPCDWELLGPHQQRGALILVRPDLDLLDAACALAEDRSDRVEVWLTVGRLHRVTDEVAEHLLPERFQFVVVQPWVVAQVLPS